jgi:hypothetical protein
MKALYDTVAQKVKPYPRNDDENVVGLDPIYVSLEVTQEPQPTLQAGESATATETINIEQLTVTYGWNVTATTPPDHKTWPNVQQFMAEFTMAEKAQIGLSTDMTIAALRIELTTWLSTVESNDARVVTGLNKLVELAIIDEARKAEILTISTP